MSARVEDQLRDYFGAVDAGQDRITVEELEGRTPDEVPLSDVASFDGPAGRRRRWLVGALAVAAATILVVTLAVIARDETGSELTPTEPSIPTAVVYVERIAFTADGDIYTMNTDGGDVVRLTDDPDGDRWPVWSPDGTRIVFESVRDGTAAVYVMDADGSNQTRLTTGVTEYNTPSWSPDGARIIATRWGECRVVCTVVMDADGSNEIQLRRGGFLPRYSPDGTAIMFEGSHDGYGPEIIVMDTDGTKPVALTETRDVAEQFAAWSPDGTQIAFTAQTEYGWIESGDLYVMNADGTNMRTVVDESGVGELHPAWSPDGTRLVYERYDETAGFEMRQRDLYIVDVDTSTVTQLTDTPFIDERAPSWALVP